MTKPTNTPNSTSERTTGETVNLLQLNNQPIEKKVTSSGMVLDVVDVFYTIQGEGPFTGRPAVFVRLAGCNLQCPACDTDYTSKREKLNIAQLVAKTATATRSPLSPKPLIVVTGGEPFRQNISPMCNKFISLGFDVQVECNGTLPPSEGLSDKVVIVCSPKAGRINAQLLERANCFKYVLDHRSINEEDGLPIRALDHSVREQVARPPKGNDRPIYLQPMDTKVDSLNKMNIREVVRSCMKHGYILQLQIHKILGVE